MTDYLYHGSPVKLTELKEPYKGRGVFLSPSRALYGKSVEIPAVKLASYEDALSIYNSLPPESQQYLAPHGRYVDARDNLLYRVLKKDKTGLPLGFMDIYKHDGKSDSGFVIVGVRPEYQGKGIGKGLLTKAIEQGKSRKMDNLVWGCMKYNTPSRSLIQSFGGQKFSDKDGYEMYKIPLSKSMITASNIHKAARMKRAAKDVPRIRKVLLGALGGGVTGFLPGAAIGSVAGLDSTSKGPLATGAMGGLIGSGIGAALGGISELLGPGSIKDDIDSIMPLKTRMARSGDILAREEDTSLNTDKDDLLDELQNYDRPSRAITRTLGYGIGGALPGAALGALATPFVKDPGKAIGVGAAVGGTLGGLYGILKKPGRGKGWKDTVLDAVLPIHGAFSQHMRTSDD